MAYVCSRVRSGMVEYSPALWVAIPGEAWQTLLRGSGLTCKKYVFTTNSDEPGKVLSFPVPPPLKLNGTGCRYMNMTVWEWFEQRSYHHRDFGGLALSGNRPERPSATLIFPARNVAGTIGTILTVVAGLQSRTGLPDQVI